jgi:hypothetical protein
VLKTVPQSGQADGNAQLLQAPLLDLAQGQIGLPGNPTAQGPVVLLQAGAPITPDLLGLALARLPVLVPKTFHTLAADPETLTDFAGTIASFPRGNNTLSQILTQRSHVPLFIQEDYSLPFNASI